MIFTRILLRIAFFGIGLDGAVSALVYFMRDIMYALAWLSVGALGEVSASAALIYAESVFSTYLVTAAVLDLLDFGGLFYHPFARPFLLGFLSRHLRSSSFWYLDRIAYSRGLWYWR